MSSKMKNAGFLGLATLVALGCADVDDPMGDPSTIIAAERCSMPDCGCGAIDQQTLVVPVPPDELGHWAAAHIEVGPDPFEVNEIVYGLAGPNTGTETATCDANVPIAIQLFVSDTAAPPANPEVLWAGSSPPVDGDALSFINVPVDPPVRVEAGQHLFVSIEMGGTADGHVCLLACEDVPTSVSDGAWWSNATEPDYPWATMTDFGLSIGYNFGVNGRVVE